MSLGLVKIFSTSFDKLKRIVPKFLYRGQKDFQTAIQVAPYGTDSNPIKDMIAVYGETNQDGSTVIIGYMNKECLALPGEHRIFATDDNGVLKGYVWIKKTGIAEVMGNADNAVRYIALNASLQQEVAKINAELTKIAAGLNAIIPGLYVVQPITLDISGSKINQIKTP